MLLVCAWHEVQSYAAVSTVWWNSSGSLVDGKPWASMLLSWNRFTMWTGVTFLAFGFSTNLLLTLLTSALFTLSLGTLVPNSRD